MVLKQINQPLIQEDWPIPEPRSGEILIKIIACGVCRTELDQIEGRISPPKLPIIPGHQPVGTVERIGEGVTKFKIGDRVGATWLYSTCGQCKFCQKEKENLCPEFRGTGCHSDGGYAEYMVIHEDFVYKIPDRLNDLIKVAPLLCGGVIGYRSLKLSRMEDEKNLGLYGFGSANHQVLQIARFLYPNSRIYVFTRNPAERELALRLGANWSGEIEDESSEKLDCIISTVPTWGSIIFALENLEKGGRLVINLIRIEEIHRDLLLKLDYAKHLWQEKEIKTVSNITRRDVEEFLPLAAEIPIIPEIQKYKLEDANQALNDLKTGKGYGSKVLIVGNDL